MPTLLLNLRHVPDDEADDIRGLFETHAIPVFETPPSRFGISAGAIWLADEAHAAQAQRVLADYQNARRDAARAEFAAARADGTAPTFWTVLRRQPVRVISAAIVIATLVALCLLPYFLLRD